MNDFCFVCVAFNPLYVEQQVRLRESILKIYPDADIIFFTDRYPPHSKTHEASHYGFKVHAIDYAKEQGFKKIIWFDPAIILEKEVDYWFDIIKNYGVIAAQDDNILVNHCSQKAFDYFGISKDDSIRNECHLVGGSVYVFDFNLQLCNKIFDLWRQSEIDGIFQSPDGVYHRNDESNLALSLYKSGSRPTPYGMARYNDGENSICIKRHFK